MHYRIIKITSRTGIIRYKYEVFIDFGGFTETIDPHFRFKTEEKAIKEAEKEIRRQEKIKIIDSNS